MKADFIERPFGKNRSCDIRDYDSISGISAKEELKIGSCVTLRIPSEETGEKKAEDVFVSITTITPPNKFTGVIRGFNPSNSLHYGGHKTDDPVTFEEKHIWP